MAQKRNINRERKRVRVDIAGSTSFTVDVSPGGLCVESMRPSAPGASVIGKLRVQDRDLEFTGVVCWAKAA
ncbi:MAG: PilZ domain-containing protein, partial [Myxococcaceae bacterium]